MTDRAVLSVIFMSKYYPNTAQNCPKLSEYYPKTAQNYQVEPEIEEE